MKMPQLNMDEVILLVDTYYNMRRTRNKNTKASFYRDLSNTLRQLPFYKDLQDETQFRSESAVEIMLNNILYKEINKDSVWARITSRQQQVMDYYQDDRYLLHDVANTIRAIVKSGLKLNIEETPDSFMGGSMLMSYHKYIETKGEQALEFLKDYRGETICAVCGQDISKIYGEAAKDLMTVHYSAPISWYPSALQLMSAEYLLLCPNCHKLAHTEVRLLEENSLRSRLGK
ncbi:MAG: hypothetical protein IKR03_02080 [Clostridia bacterium]|nr:hypothetical protein [Clostridia bacterium]